MAGKEHCFLRMRMVRKTDNAVMVSGSTYPGEGLREYWLPRSQMGTMTTSPDFTKAGNYPHCNFSLPEWLVEREALWDFVTS